MVSLNVGLRQRPSGILTFEGAPAKLISPLAQLKRLVMACMLWEDQFYIDGESSADQIAAAVKAVNGQEAAHVAIYAREEAKLRHVGLLIVREMARNAHQRLFVSKTLERIIQRPDELAEFLLIYDANYARGSGKDPQPLSAQVKKGLAAAFRKFNEYQLAKYNREGLVRLKDVLFLSHAKPKDGVKGFNRARRKALREGKVEPSMALGEGSHLFHKLVMDTLDVPDTWETNLSAGKEKGETFLRLMEEGKLGALALLRNLRNMKDANVAKETVGGYLQKADLSRVLPFRFIAAAAAVPEWEDVIEPALIRCMGEGQSLVDGPTAILVDVSGSMVVKLSGKSQMSRMDAACGIAILAREIFQSVMVAAFSTSPHSLPPRRGFALRDAIIGSHAVGGGTDTGLAISTLNQKTAAATPYARLIVITDEQTYTAYPDPLPGSKAYVINVGAYQNGVGYGRWTHIDGFSEATLKFILALEAEEAS